MDSAAINQVPVFIVVKRDIEDGKNVFLQIVELGYKTIVVSVGQLHVPLNDVLELFEHELGSRIAHILLVGHEAVQAAVATADTIPCGSFHEHDHLQGDFEQKQKRFDPLGRVQVNGLDVVGPLGPAEGLLALVLVLVRQHRLLDAQLIGGLVG